MRKAGNSGRQETEPDSFPAFLLFLLSLWFVFRSRPRRLAADRRRQGSGSRWWALLALALLLSACTAPGVFVPTAQNSVVPASSALELVWSGGEFTEGGAIAADGTVLFSDIGNRILRFDPRTGATTVFREPSGRANGMMVDGAGRLFVCEGANGGNRRVSVTEADGAVRTLADRWRGKRFNSPNDLCLDGRGRVYFTDPRYVGDEPRELEFEGVFLVEADGTVKLATRDVSRPNGILVSIDGSRVYVADNDTREGGPRELLVFDVLDDGTLSGKRVLHRFGPTSRGIDGMTMDVDGAIYATAGSGEEAGVYVFGPDGEHLALIRTPGDPTNCVFGTGSGERTLYITAHAPAAGSFGLFRIELSRRGYHRR